MKKQYRNISTGKIVTAERLNPLSEHKMDLPEGVVGVPSPGSDNWAYEGCVFSVPVENNMLTINPGDWVVKEDGVYHPVTADQFQIIYVETDFQKSCDNCGNKTDEGKCEVSAIPENGECGFWKGIPAGETRKQMDSLFAKRLGW